MGWKSMSSWSKGIILSIFIWILLSIIFAIFSGIRQDGYFGFAFILVMMVAPFFPGFLIFGSLDTVDNIGGYKLIIAFIVSLISWLIFGVLIGWIIEKRKNDTTQ